MILSPPHPHPPLWTDFYYRRFLPTCHTDFSHPSFFITTFHTNISCRLFIRNYLICSYPYQFFIPPFHTDFLSGLFIRIFHIISFFCRHFLRISIRSFSTFFFILILHTDFVTRFFIRSFLSVVFDTNYCNAVGTTP